MTTPRARRIVLALACIVPAHQAAAQTVMPGARVRVVDAASSNPLMVGQLGRLVGDSVTILSAANLASSGSQTTWVVGGQHRLEVRTVLRRRTGRGVLIGALLGAPIGAAIGFATRQGGDDLGLATSVFGGAIMLAIPGMVIGGRIGHHVTTTTWRQVDHPPVRVGIAPALGRGVLLSASIAF